MLNFAILCNPESNLLISNAFDKCKIDVNTRFFDSYKKLTKFIYSFDAVLIESGFLETDTIVEKLIKKYDCAVCVKVSDDQEFIKYYNIGADAIINRPTMSIKVESMIGRLNRKTKFTKSPSTSICVSDHRGKHILKLSKISSFQANEKYIDVNYCGRIFTITGTINSLENKYPSFLRVNRSCIVNKELMKRMVKTSSIDGLKHMTGFSIYVDNCKEPFKISRREVPNVRKFLRQL